MEKVLELYKYVDGVAEPFPNSDEQVVVASFRCDYTRMGAAPTITFSVNHSLCLDDLWSKDVFATFNGERFFIKQIPTSSFSNQDARYKHDVELVSERSILDNVYFYDVVSSNVSYDRPVSNSSKFSFFGDVSEYAERLNHSLKWSKVGYSIVVDEGVVSSEELVSFENQVITNALQEIYNIYKIPYYFVGTTIHIGEYKNNVDKVFKYGVEDSLLSISKNNANSKIVNRITGVGSPDNIPYYYPNDDEKGVTQPLLNGSTNGVSIVNSSKYRKVRMSDTFKYASSAQYLVSLIEGKRYTLGDLRMEGGVEGKYKYVLDFYYSITLSQAENVQFSVDTDYEQSLELRYEVFKTSGYHVGYFSKETTLALTGGTYNFIVRWTFTSDTPLSVIDEAIQEFISQNLIISADIVVDASNSWTLNGVPVKLDKYGLAVSNPSDGDVISFKRIAYILPQPNLMPPIYRENEGNERFYNAKNNTYVNSETGEYFHFENEYSNTQPREHIENFETIRPTIKNVRNGSGERIDSFIAFAYDTNDNDEVDEKNEYIHPYFFAKLRKFDGENGFNLFDHAIDEGEMTISMTSGSCGSCEFTIMVGENQKNTVQVDEYGNLLRDSEGNVRFGSPQDVQNDTENNEVWIALKKDVNTFGVIMPNASNNYRPLAGDTFVILHIDLPKKYITDAEKALELELLKFMEENNSEKFNFSITFSRIFFAENPTILSQLSENSKIQIEYNKKVYDLYISSLTYSMDSNSPLPDIKVELSDVITISQNAINQVVSSTKKEILSAMDKDVVWSDIKGIPSWITNEKPRYSYSELAGAAQSSDSVWSIKQTEDGTLYIHTTYPVVTQQGITMYADGTNLNLPSIYDGLVIDGDTIYWEETTDENGNKVKVLKSKGGGEGNGSFGEIEITGEGNAITKVDVVKGDEETPDKLVFSKEKTFIEKEVLEKDYLTKAFIEENYYNKTKTDELFFKKDDAKGLFVTLDETEQEILGLKTFKNGLNIGSSKIWQSQDDVVYIDANLAVRGSLTFFAVDGVKIPTIMESLNLDPETLKLDEQGRLTVIGGGGGSIEYALSWSGFSSGSYDGTEAKSIYIPSKVSELTNDALYAKTSDLADYLPRTGGTLTGDLKIMNGTSAYGSSLLFGDGEYVYISEDKDVDDHMLIYARAGIELSCESSYGVVVNNKVQILGNLVADGTYAFMPMNSNGYGLYFHGLNLSIHNNHSYVEPLFSLDGDNRAVFAKTPMVTSIGYLATQTWVGNGYLSLSGGNLTGDLYITNGKTLYVSTIRGIGSDGVNRAFMTGGGTGNFSFGGYYAGKYTALNGETIKLNAADYEKMTITSEYVQIKQSTFDNGLRLVRTAANSGCGISVYSNSTHIGNFGLNGNYKFEVSFPYVNGIVFTVDSTGNGLFYGSLTFLSTSDKRLKENIRSFNACERLMSLGGVYEFEYKDNEVKRNPKYKGTHIGLIYQNVKGTSLERMCMEREDGFGSLNYIDTSFISLLAGVGMEHETRIQRLERENKELRMEVERLKRM